MRTKMFLVIVLATALLLTASESTEANGSPPFALTGQVSSQKEGAMEGVVVGAKKEGSTVTVNVTTDEKGRYSFPQRNCRRDVTSLRYALLATILTVPRRRM